jgi:hypothetical protein
MKVNKERIQFIAKPEVSPSQASTVGAANSDKVQPDTQPCTHKKIWAKINENKISFCLVTVVLIFIVYQVVTRVIIPHYATDATAKNTENQTSLGLNIKNIESSGTYVFNLKADSSTGWLGFSEGRIVDVSYSSPDYNYILNYSDGTSYHGGRDAIVPEKRHCYVNVVAKTNQFVTMVVKYR